MSYTIGIIGSGNIGRGLALHLSGTGHQVLISNSRGTESLEAVVHAIGGSLKASELKETIRQCDVIFIAVPWTSLTNLAEEFIGYEGKSSWMLQTILYLLVLLSWPIWVEKQQASLFQRCSLRKR